MELDTNCFKAFLAAVETMNFTEAAKISNMTQSGISQHIAKLESDLNTNLFKRVGKKVYLSETGRQLIDFIESYQDSLAKLSEEVSSIEESLTGKVRYAMPASCLLSPHFSMLLTDKTREYPEVELEVNLCSSHEVMEQVLTDKIDFGFMTEKIENSELNYQKFCLEEYVLVSSQNLCEKKIDFDQAKWICYPDSQMLFDAWMKNHLGRRKKPKFKYQGQTNSIHVALSMVAHGLGISVFPKHTIYESSYTDKLKIHFSKEKSCSNTIYIVSLKSSFKPRRVLKVINSFIAM